MNGAFPATGASTLPAVSTRALILSALLCGMAILIAFAVQVIIAT